MYMRARVFIYNLKAARALAPLTSSHPANNRRKYTYICINMYAMIKQQVHGHHNISSMNTPPGNQINITSHSISSQDVWQKLDVRQFCITFYRQSNDFLLSNAVEICHDRCPFSSMLSLRSFFKWFNPAKNPVNILQICLFLRLKASIACIAFG